jgi:RES domain-containing protein
MTASVWRIATDTPDYEADDLSGAGAKATGGRWNEKGAAVLYCSASIALAALETLVHLGSAGLPLNRYLVRLDIPDHIFAAAEVLDAATAPVGWDARPAGRASIACATRWLAGRKTLCLVVPSIVAPEESNILINPLHPDIGRITATKLRRWDYDPRLRGGPGPA